MTGNLFNQGSAIYPLIAVLGGVELLVDSPLVLGCYSLDSTFSATPTNTTSMLDCLFQCGPGQLAAVTNGFSCFCFQSFPHDNLLPSQVELNQTCFIFPFAWKVKTFRQVIYKKYFLQGKENLGNLCFNFNYRAAPHHVPTTPTCSVVDRLLSPLLSHVSSLNFIIFLHN